MNKDSEFLYEYTKICVVEILDLLAGKGLITEEELRNTLGRITDRKLAMK